MGYRPLGECIESVIDHRGLTPKKLGGDWSQFGYRALSAKNVKNGALVQEDAMNRVSNEMYHRWMPEEVERGDVFITSEAPFGEVLYWDSDEKLVLSQRVFGLKVNRDICDAISVLPRGAQRTSDRDNRCWPQAARVTQVHC